MDQVPAWLAAAVAAAGIATVYIEEPPTAPAAVTLGSDPGV